jgi:DNA-binding MarR family transcriptional regulator
MQEKTRNLMPSTQLNFANFSFLMQTNWPTAHAGLFLLFPRIEKIANNINAHIEQLMKEQGLLTSDFHLLTAIRRSKKTPPFELKPSELCNYLLFSWGGLTKVMKRLEEKAIILRVSCEHDKRISMIRLTEKGQDIIERSVFKLQKIHQELLIGFNHEEIALLDKLLAKLLNNIESS